MISFAAGALLAAIALDGVSGGELRAQARFDSNNVHVGDPMILTIDFVGEADFASLHPPALAREVDRSVWKVDDASARTETYRDARRLTYRVRPLKDGVIVFPQLAFSYTSTVSNTPATVTTCAVPVHAKPGTQVALGDLDLVGADLPKPDGIVIDLSASPWGSGAKLGEDMLFAWRKACAKPSAAAFAQFDFPEARLNEAACELMDGNWARARHIYSVLEWRIGQTPQIERGLVAAAAQKTGDAGAELPMWRQVLRPVLRLALAGRVLAFAGAVLALVALLAAMRFAARRLACIAAFAAAALAAAPASAANPFGGQDPFAEIERMRQQMQQQMHEQFEQMSSMMGSFGNGAFSMSINGQPAPKVEIKASIVPDRTGLVAGEPFNMILSLEIPRSCTVSLNELVPSQSVGYKVAGNIETMTDGRTSDTNNIVRRISIPVRYDAPFKGRVTYRVGGMYEARVKSGGPRGGFFNSMFSSSFSVATPPIWMEVRPLDPSGQPADFSGAVGTAFKLAGRANMYKVETNDVVTIELTLDYTGYIPPDALPDAMPAPAQPGFDGRLVQTKYFVADGSPTTPGADFCYYDVTAKGYRRATAKGQPLLYSAGEEAEAETVVVNTQSGEAGGRRLRLRFAPAESAPEVAAIDSAAAKLTVTEARGAWVRVDDGRHAGWAREGELK